MKLASNMENRMHHPQLMKKLLTLTVLFSLCAALVVGIDKPVKADITPVLPLSKLSPDLKQLIASGNGGSRVRLIVQTAPSQLGLIGGLLQLVGGTLKALLSNLNISIVDTNANSAPVIAAGLRASAAACGADTAPAATGCG